MGETEAQTEYHLFQSKVGREPNGMLLPSHHQPETFPSHRLLYKLTQAELKITARFRFISPKE